MSFSMSHTVTLKHPMSVVYPALSSPDQMARLQGLTPEGATFTLLPSDTVELPAVLSAIRHAGHPKMGADMPRVRGLPSVPANPEKKVVQRTHFSFSGHVPLLFGLIHRPLSVSGAQIVDSSSHVVLFESGVAASGIKELKLRTFREVDLGKGKRGTEVKETVWGTCESRVLALLLKVIAPATHREHMELYWKLFEDGEGS